MHETSTRAERAFLVGVRSERQVQADADALFQELKGLASTLGLESAGEFRAKLRETHPRLLFGEGKAQEVLQAAKASEADSIVFNHVLSPSQQRNWEELSGMTVYDRQELIIRIFSSRARTREAVLQTELASLEYALPRLAHSREGLSRQRGGRYGTKGSGEQKLELDRREIRKRIARIKDELIQVRQDRQTMRKKRDRVPVASAAIVGYTNAGKSSLLNALTDASVLAEEKLFATLDPTTRKLSVGEGQALLLTDTVGFIRALPHALVEAFRATLEEALNADFLVQVLDASDPAATEQHRTTRAVLEELGAADKPSLVVLNKVDALSDPLWRESLMDAFPDAIFVSARTREGLEELSRRLRAFLAGLDALEGNDEAAEKARREAELGPAAWGK